ncbi:MAG: hypothetical protein KDA57_05780 [Planctomycetales bacterium]|nr:hypothetical protein [Planctomycetales bacterium]
MKSFVSRRLYSATLMVVVLALLVYWTLQQKWTLGHSSFGTGYVLLATLFFLALYNIRKKLPVLPWASSSDWLQAHVYVALGTAVLFGLHVDWRLPTGFLESTIAVLYGATFVSGIVGLIWTRTIPAKLARVSEEVIYERIPMLRSQLCERAQEAVLEAVRSSGATTLGEFYSERLHPYFESSRRIGYFVRPNSRLRRRLLAELTEMNRYLSPDERETCEILFALVRRRDDLDFHAAMQWRLKMWLFLHLGLTYPLLAVASVHGLVAHLFDGGVL